MELEDHGLEWLDEKNGIINAELKIDGKWYQGFVEIVILD
jgi:hypothetical protein